MKMSDTISELAAALCMAQAEIEDAEKVKNNPAFRSKYADLGAVWDAAKPALTKYGLSIAQFCEPSEAGTLALTTMLMHKSGQYIAGTEVLPLAKTDPQGYGSAMTYARRYGLAAMVGVCPEDDDANAATFGKAPQPAPPVNRAPSAPAAGFAPAKSSKPDPKAALAVAFKAARKEAGITFTADILEGVLGMPEGCGADCFDDDGKLKLAEFSAEEYQILIDYCNANVEAARANAVLPPSSDKPELKVIEYEPEPADPNEQTLKAMAR